MDGQKTGPFLLRGQVRRDEADTRWCGARDTDCRLLGKVTARSGEGRSHNNIPAGQGEIREGGWVWTIKEAVAYLDKVASTVTAPTR